jgi:hypothetical protein
LIAMLRRHLLLLLVLAIAGCDFGSGDPPTPPWDGTGIGTPDLVSDPDFLTLDPTCAGGTRRASLLLGNEAEWDVDAMAGGTAGVEAYPSTFEVAAHGASEMLVVIRVPETTAATVRGKIEVRHRREGLDEESDPLIVPWSVDIVASKTPSATVLCGEVMSCTAIDFGSIFVGAVWQQPLEVVNDGCAPLRVERITLEGADMALAGPALPLILEAGDRWQGALLYEPGPQGARRGSVVVVTDDEGKPQQRILWSADVRQP